MLTSKLTILYNFRRQFEQHTEADAPQGVARPHREEQRSGVNVTAVLFVKDTFSKLATCVWLSK